MFANVFVKRLGILSLLLLSSLAASVSAQVTGFSNYCELRLTGCPQDYNYKEIVVPLYVVSLSTKVRACGRQNSDGSAKSIIISSAGVKDTAGEIGGEFTFKRQLPLDTAEITNVSMAIKYDVLHDSLHVIIPDSLFAYNFTIRRSANPGANWNKDESGNIIFDTDCKTRTLDLQYEGVSLIGREVRGNMGKLDIVFTDESNPNRVNIGARNANGDILDVENFLLSLKNGKWTYQFSREISASATPGDGKLQHTGRDSIILVYRNPNVPLDSLRVAVPYISNAMAFYGKDGNPISQQLVPLPDPYTLMVGDTLNIYAKFFNPDGSWDEAMTNSGKIKWNVDGVPRVYLTEDGAHCIFHASIVGGIYTVTATYTDGPLVIKKDITIKVVSDNDAIQSFDRIIPIANPNSEATVVTPVASLTAEFTAGPNPVGALRATPVRFFRQGSRISSASLFVYDATGNPVKKVIINDNAAIGGNVKRPVGSWDLTDAKSRPVSGGTYLVRGTVKTSNGKSERVSLVVGVR